MMKSARASRAMGDHQTASVGRNKTDTSANGATNQPTSAQTIRKRRSSINVYDQPSSLNSRLRQLETDMLRLDEDRTKLFDDTHATLTNYELKLGEVHAILKSRQDNVEKYVEDMRTLLQAKEDFEKQTKMLGDKQDRLFEKFTHRETIVSREIKLLKNKFELLERSRQFKSLLQKGGVGSLGDANITIDSSSLGDGSQLRSYLSENDSLLEGTDGAKQPPDASGQDQHQTRAAATHQTQAKSRKKKVKISRIGLSRYNVFSRLFGPLLTGAKSLGRRKSNKISSLSPATTATVQAADPALASVYQTEPAADLETVTASVAEGLLTVGLAPQ